MTLLPAVHDVPRVRGLLLGDDTRHSLQHGRDLQAEAESEHVFEKLLCRTERMRSAIVETKLVGVVVSVMGVCVTWSHGVSWWYSWRAHIFPPPGVWVLVEFRNVGLVFDPFPQHLRIPLVVSRLDLRVFKDIVRFLGFAELCRISHVWVLIGMVEQGESTVSGLDICAAGGWLQAEISVCVWNFWSRRFSHLDRESMGY